MTDILNMDMINSLPQPIFGKGYGGDNWWPIVDIDVETGLCRIDVCGLLEVRWFSDFRYIRDDANTMHDPETFYLDYEAE